MKIVYFASYYNKYLDAFLQRNLDFKFLTYKEQIERIKSDYFGVFGSYTDYANKHGNEASLIIPNFELVQKKWAAENNFTYSDKNWLTEISIAQIKKIQPDAFFMGSMFNFYGAFLKEIRPYCKAIYTWIACPIPKGIDLTPIDLILTSVPEYVNEFRAMNINSELLPAAFDTNILTRIDTSKQKKNIDFSFIGGFSDAHQKRKTLVEGLIKETPLKLYGYGVEKKSSLLMRLKDMYKDSIENRYKGEAWGLGMYELLGRSKITFNVHIDMALGNRVNMRMYEATRMGTLMLTDKSKNSTLNYFKDGEEVVEYDSLEDAIEKYNYYISHDKEREAIAKKGQQRTCNEYNSDRNSIMMTDYFKKYL
jgi:spore maturation protein CgeB